MPSKSGAAVGTGNAVFQDLDQTTFKSNLAFNYNGSTDRVYRFPSFIISLKTDFFSASL